MARGLISLIIAANLTVAWLAGAAPATAADVDAQNLLSGRVVETWGACEMPGGFVVVQHDGWTSEGEALGMRLFSGRTPTRTSFDAGPATRPAVGCPTATTASRPITTATG